MLSSIRKKRETSISRIIENRNRIFFVRHPIIINALSRLTEDEIVIIFNKIIKNHGIKPGHAADFMFLLTQKLPDNNEIRGAAMTLLLNASQQHDSKSTTNPYFIRHTFLLQQSTNKSSSNVGSFMLKNNHAHISAPDLKLEIYNDILKYAQDELIELHHSKLKMITSTK